MVKLYRVLHFATSYTRGARLIFEHFPLIKETIGEESLKYTSSELGSLFLLLVKEEKVRFYFKKKKITKIHTFEQEKSYYYLCYNKFKKIDREEIIEIFNQY